MTAGLTETFYGTVCEVHPEENGLRYRLSKLCPLCAKIAGREQRARELENGIVRKPSEFKPQAHILNKLWPIKKKKE